MTGGAKTHRKSCRNLDLIEASTMLRGKKFKKIGKSQWILEENIKDGYARGTSVTDF